MGGAPEDVMGVTVTCDCTWSKRGFTAPYGVAMVISWDTGEVLDCEVLSRQCRKCVLWEGHDRSSEAYMQWYDGHKDHCNVNFAGSAPAIEAEGVLRIWQRSVSRLGLHYTSVISDGDSKAIATLREKRPYGDTESFTNPAPTMVTPNTDTGLSMPIPGVGMSVPSIITMS